MLAGSLGRGAPGLELSTNIRRKYEYFATFRCQLYLVDDVGRLLVVDVGGPPLVVDHRVAAPVVVPPAAADAGLLVAGAVVLLVNLIVCAFVKNVLRPPLVVNCCSILGPVGADGRFGRYVDVLECQN